MLVPAISLLFSILFTQCPYSNSQGNKTKMEEHFHVWVLAGFLLPCLTVTFVRGMGWPSCAAQLLEELSELQMSPQLPERWLRVGNGPPGWRGSWDPCWGVEQEGRCCLCCVCWVMWLFCAGLRAQTISSCQGRFLPQSSSCFVLLGPEAARRKTKMCLVTEVSSRGQQQGCPQCQWQPGELCACPVCPCLGHLPSPGPAARI